MSGVRSLGLRITATAQEEPSWQFRGPGMADILSTVRAARLPSCTVDVRGAGASHPHAEWLQNGCQATPTLEPPPHITGPPCPPANFCSPSAKSCRCGANPCKSLQIAANRCGKPARWHRNPRPGWCNARFRMPLSRACGTAPCITRQTQRTKWPCDLDEFT